MRVLLHLFDVFPLQPHLHFDRRFRHPRIKKKKENNPIFIFFSLKIFRMAVSLLLDEIVMKGLRNLHYLLILVQSYFAKL